MKDAMVVIRLTMEQKEKLQEVASDAGMHLSEYIRMLVLKDLQIIK